MACFLLRFIVVMITITLQLSSELAEITGFNREEIVVSDGCPFLFFLKSFLVDYPEMEHRYSPGKLAFSLNGHAPGLQSVLQDDDYLRFWVYGPSFQ